MIVAALLVAALGGCVVVPADYDKRGYARGPYYDHDREHYHYYYRAGYGG